jgi:hypothetical protein
MDLQAFQPITMAFTKAGLTASGAATTVSQTLAGGATTNIFAIKSKMYSAAALSSTATPTTDWATGSNFNPIKANQGSVFVIGFDHSGNLRAIQGQVSSLDTVSYPGNFLTAPQFGAFGPAGSTDSSANDFCPIAYMVVAAGSTANNTTGWTFGSSNWNATGITVTIDDVCGWPPRPQVA